MVEINKKFGFYGTIKNYIGSQQQVRTIWNIMLQKLSEMYPEKTSDECAELLNSSVGRHLADELTDMPDKPNPHIVMLRIALLNRLKFDRWWAWFYGVKLPSRELNMRLLYKNAIENQMGQKFICDKMAKLIGCGSDKVWHDPKMWLNADNTTTEELEIMWSYIQAELKTKRTNDGHKRKSAK